MFAFLAVLSLVGAASAAVPPASSLAQTAASDTPVTRVVNLLKEISKTLDKEAKEDEDLYHQLSCWCNDGKYEKTEAIKASTAKIAELESTIESLTANSAQLGANEKDLEAELASDKAALAEATALRQKQLAEFHEANKDSVQAIETLKAALVVLAKHHKAPPESTVAGGAVFKSTKDEWATSLLEVQTKEFPWEARAASARSLEGFMRENGFGESAPDAKVVAPHKFLQQQASGAATDAEETWSAEDTLLVRRAVQSASALLQARHGSRYTPAYQAQSGEVVGVLKQLKEQMEGDLAEAQKEESLRAGAFEELRAAKTAEIEDAEKILERKEDEKANGDNALAEAKEDLGQEQNVLAADTEFLKNLEATCATAGTNFDERKKVRLAEMQAVAETIQILQGDEARDAFSSTFKGFLQVASASRLGDRRQLASKALREAAKRLHSPQLSILATSVELDAFTKVKKAIDDMISMLKQQTEDEVKKNDWCKAEIQANEMTNAKTEDLRADLEAKIAELESTIKTLEGEIAAAEAQLAQVQLDFQRASEDRQKENLDFQKTVADQTTTIEVLKKALDRLANFYDFAQRSSKGAARRVEPAPPVPQAEYSKNKGAGGVMEMIEKLIQDAKELVADSKKSESESQAAYEQLLADTNASVESLQKEILSKTGAKAQADKDRLSTEESLMSTVKELEALNKYNGDLHKECDYLLKNFDVRQKGRGEEVEALQQAKQILSGASLS